MNTPTKLGAYAIGLAALFAAATGVGIAVGPVGPADDEHSGANHSSSAPDSAPEASHTAHDSGSEETEETAPEPPPGLMVSDRGYTLELAQDTAPAGPGTPLAFRILGADGQPVTSYEESHDKALHLIAVRRDTTGFQHVHPDLAADGTWTVSLDLSAGSWRVFADFVPAEGELSGQTLTLGADLAVAGNHRPAPLPNPSAVDRVDGYTVTLDGTMVPGEETELTLSVSRDGKPVTDLQPYLAAYGHLVALRAGDLAYLHVHPAGEPGDGRTEPGPDITFYATAPSTGDYRLFLDFQHDGVVRTAEFTAPAGEGTASGDAAPDSASGDQPDADDPDADGHSH
ncbi:MAG: hypothetical protein H0U62_09510 [Actinobacteria bacterium]|nr:hypothetical protein [Actinomycetota bacterium]